MTVRNAREEEAIKNFLKVEAECDAYNLEQMKLIGTGHLKKTKAKQVEVSVRQWKTASNRMSKLLKENAQREDHKRYRFTSKERTWLMKD